jgi:lysyl-tRNA synthetase class 2
MKITIFPQIFIKYPKLNVGIVIINNLDNAGSDEKIFHLLEEVEEFIRLNFVPGNLAQHPLISPWRAAYSEFGAKPSKYQSSVESLTRKILKTNEILRVNKLVDISNYLSLKYLVPTGVDDIDKIEGNISLTLSKGDEIFIPLNSTEVQHPDKGEVIYRDDRNVLCRKWNWQGCDKTKISEKTKRAVIYIEGLLPVTKEKVKEICEEAVNLIKLFCNGDAKYHILNLAKPEISF